MSHLSPGECDDAIELMVKDAHLSWLCRRNVDMASGRKPLYQLHWQNRANLKETDFVAQSGEGWSMEEVMEWVRELCERRRAECPEGWMPLLCHEDSEYFVRAPTEVTP